MFPQFYLTGWGGFGRFTGKNSPSGVGLHEQSNGGKKKQKQNIIFHKEQKIDISDPRHSHLCTTLTCDGRTDRRTDTR